MKKLLFLIALCPIFFIYLSAEGMFGDMFDETKAGSPVEYTYKPSKPVAPSSISDKKWDSTRTSTQDKTKKEAKEPSKFDKFTSGVADFGKSEAGQTIVSGATDIVKNIANLGLKEWEKKQEYDKLQDQLAFLREKAKIEAQIAQKQQASSPEIDQMKNMINALIKQNEQLQAKLLSVGSSSQQDLDIAPIRPAQRYPSQKPSISVEKLEPKEQEIETLPKDINYVNKMIEIVSDVEDILEDEELNIKDSEKILQARNIFESIGTVFKSYSQTESYQKLSLENKNDIKVKARTILGIFNEIKTLKNIDDYKPSIASLLKEIKGFKKSLKKLK